MLSPVSFGSTYRIYYKENSDKVANYYSTIGFCDSQNIPYINNFMENAYAMVSPENKDKYLETYMANKGITYHKLDNDSLMTPRLINSRIMKAPKGMYKILIDADKFEEMVKNTDGNYNHCKSNYDKYYKEQLETHIKSGEPIPAASLYLVPKASDLSDFIDRYGTEHVDKYMLDTIFDMSHVSEDSSMYFAMKDAGMKKIPVYMDKESYTLAHKMGILAE